MHSFSTQISTSIKDIIIKNNSLSRWVQAVSNFQTDYAPKGMLRIHFPI